MKIDTVFGMDITSIEKFSNLKTRFLYIGGLGAKRRINITYHKCSGEPRNFLVLMELC